MSKTKKVVIITTVAIFLFLVGYFFMPKKETKCTAFGGGDTCTTCVCTRGFPIIDEMFMQIGGKSEPDCFMGKLLECKTVDASDLK